MNYKLWNSIPKMDPHKNYECLKMHVELLENYPLTEDRLDAYKKFYRVIRDHFPNLELVNQENEEMRFRQATKEGEMCMQKLDADFHPAVYLQLLRIIMFIVDELTEYYALTDMLDSLSF